MTKQRFRKKWGAWWRRLLRCPVPLSEAKVTVTNGTWFKTEDLVNVPTGFSDLLGPPPTIVCTHREGRG